MLEHIVDLWDTSLFQLASVVATVGISGGGGEGVPPMQQNASDVVLPDDADLPRLGRNGEEDVCEECAAKDAEIASLRERLTNLKMIVRGGAAVVLDAVEADG